MKLRTQCAGLAAVIMAVSTATPAADPAAPISGLDIQSLDRTVRPQDDLFRYANGKWLAATEIPPDRSAWGSYLALGDTVQGQLRGLVESAGNGAEASAEERKIADLYASFMDEDHVEALGASPLKVELEMIRALNDKADIPALIGYFNRIEVTAPLVLYVNQDARESTHYAVGLYQAGLGLPDRDYYLKDDAKLKETRDKYQAHVATMLGLIGDEDAKGNAKDILALETELARAQWSQVDNRDPVKTYNKLAISNLGVLAAHFDWPAYLAAAGVTGKVDSLIVNQPSFVRGFDDILARTPLTVWKAYFRWQLLRNTAPYLSKIFLETRFAFYGTVLRGTTKLLPRWKRAMTLIDESIGEGLGKLYVAKYFPPSSKARTEELVRNLLEAYKFRIDTLDWMSPATKAAAQAKLAKIIVKIGYPDRWRNYSSLVIARDDLLGNIRRAITRLE